MICERCKKKKVSVIHRSMKDGELSVRHVCAGCSEVLEATGELKDISAVLPPYTASMIEEDGGSFPFFLISPTDDPLSVCPLCGMTAEELIADGRAGCPQCYAAFAPLITGAAHLLHGQGGTLTHRGTIPGAAKERRARKERLVLLRERLREAVAAEQYENAATLRDEIRALESGMGA